MNKFNKLTPSYGSTGVSIKGNVESLLDTRAMFKDPVKAMPQFISLGTDYPDGAKYMIGKNINVDAIFTQRLRTVDITNLKWEFSPKDVLVEKRVTMPDGRSVRKTFVPKKHGNVQIQVTYTDAKKQETTKTLMLQIENTHAQISPLGTTKIVSFLFTDNTIEELQIGQEFELKVLFDKPLPETEKASLIYSDNLKTDGLVLSPTRKSGTITFTAVEEGYSYIKIGTTGTPYLGFSDLVVRAPEEELKLVSISNPLEVIKGQTVDCVLTFNNFLSEEPSGLNINLNNANITEVSKKVEGKKLKVTYRGAVEGATTVTAQLGEDTPSSTCNVTVKKEASTINTATVDNAEVAPGQTVTVSLEFDEYPVLSKIQIQPTKQSAFTKKGNLVVEDKTVKQAFIANTPGRHKINATYGESTKDVDVTIKAKPAAKKAE